MKYLEMNIPRPKHVENQQYWFRMADDVEGCRHPVELLTGKLLEIRFTFERNVTGERRNELEILRI
jgi:hypothetical protein